MRKMAESKGMYLCLQLVVLVCLADAWYSAGAEMFRNAAVFLACGILALAVGLICLIRTARTPYPEECANALNLVFHGLAAAFLLRTASVSFGLYHIFLPDAAGIMKMLRYDVDDGIVFIVTSFGFAASLIGLAACILLVCMGLTARRAAAGVENR